MTAWYKPWKTRGRGGKAPRSARKLSWRVPLCVEALEDRLLLSLTSKLLLDINPGTADSSPSQFTLVNNLVFFSANDGTHGPALWASAGTSAGTSLVADISPIITGSGAGNLTNVNGTLFFSADDGTHGAELWESNGTAAGTFLVKDIRSGASGSNPYDLTNVNGTLFFSAKDGTTINGTLAGELWRSNGTAAGTSQVEVINSSGSVPEDLTNVNGTLFFSADTGAHGAELWLSNGTTAGSGFIDINPGPAGSNPTDLTNVNGTLFFQANDGSHGNELFEFNGTALSSVGPAGFNPTDLTNVNGTLFFQANDGSHGNELFEFNGTALSFFDVNPGPAGSNPTDLTNVNGTLFFSASDGSHGNELWESNGTAAGTAMVKDINSRAAGAGAYPTYLVNVNGTLFFSANNNTYGTELWESNGTAAGTFLAADVYPGLGSSNPKYLTNANGVLVLSANDRTHGREPWILIPSSSTSVASSPNPAGLGQTVTFTATLAAVLGLTPTGTVDFKEGSSDLTPGGVSLVAGQATFSTSNLSLGSHVISAFYSGDSNFPASQGDDSANPQVVTKLKLLADINPGGALAFDFTQVNNLTFFAAYDGTHGTELWESNGSAAGTFLVADINPGSFGSYPSQLTNVNGTLFFGATDGTSTQELWRSNGTAAGTFLLKDINPGLFGSYPSYLTNVNGTLFFQANDSTHGDELWESNGTTAGTFIVKDIGPNALSSTDLTNVNGTLFFAADDGTLGDELWASNGTTAGTFLVKDIHPGSGSSYPSQLTNVSGTLLFAADNGTLGDELWASNGTTAGTFLVKDINPGKGNSIPYNLTNVNGTLFFNAFDGSHGRELWESNGSTAGTFLVQDINPGAGYSKPYHLTNVNGTVFFQANDGTHGFELWESNGSAAGTFLVQDINPGTGNSYPKYLTNVNGTLFFEASDGAHGYELWESNGSAAGTFMVQDINPGASDSSPKYLTNVNGELFFSANDGVHGAEPWILVSTATTASVSSTPNPSVLGKAVTFTATVGVFPGLPGPTGTVDFKEGSTDLTPGGVALTNGRATFSTTSLGVGSDTITATYSGDSNFTGSQGDDSAKPQVVQKDSTSVTLISPSAPVSGQSVEFVAVVANTSGPFGAPTGQVQFAVDGTNLGTPVTLAGGVALSLPTRLSATGGPHTITATYTNSDGNFVGSSKSVIQAVSKDGTRTILASTPSTAVAGQVVVFTAAIVPVAPGSGTPTGTVDFKDGATDLTPGGISLSAGRAFFTTSSLGLGHHTVTASYSGDASFTGSSGNDVNSLVVNQASSRTVMASFPDPAVFGQVVSFTVAVLALAPSHGTPTGTVTFTDGATTIGTVTVNNVGRATFTTASLSRGNHAINANYGGDVKFLASNYAGFGETVLKDATTTTVTASANPAVVGTTVTFTAAVQANSPGAGKATGSVVFKDFSTALATLTLNSAGQATFTSSTLALGTHAITATYVGDTNFLASVSVLLAESVKSSAMAATQTSALALSAVRPVAQVSQAGVSPLMTPRPRVEAALTQSGGAAPAMSDPSRLDRYFAAIATPSAVRRLGQLAAPRHDLADWLDDPFLRPAEIREVT